MSLSSLTSLSDVDVPCSSNTTTCYEKITVKSLQKYNDNEFRKLFRLRKDTVLHLVHLIGNNIKHLTKRNKAMEPLDQILIALRYFATGSCQKVIGSTFDVDKGTVHRTVHKVAAELEKLSAHYITMPNIHQQQDVASGFSAISGFPKVLGALDCFQIEIKSPGGELAESYKNSRGIHSLSVQVVCDSNLLIRDIAISPGSVEKSTIFHNSFLCSQLEHREYSTMYLLGDSHYPCKSYLLTPISNPLTAAEEAYNKALNSTRKPVELLFYVLKSRFNCLHYKLSIKIKNVAAIIIACAVLHNIAIERNDLLVQDDDTICDVTDCSHDFVSRNNDEDFSVRSFLINNYFPS